jgi:hypothetical protein
MPKAGIDRWPTWTTSCTAPRWSPTRSSSASGARWGCSPPAASATSWRWAPSSATTSTTCSCSSRSRWCRATGASRCRALDPTAASCRRSTRPRCAPRSAQLVAPGVQCGGVCFLHAYPQPGARAAAVRDILLRRRRVPAAGAVSLSSAVVPEISEYQRCVDHAANAFVQPLMSAYLGRCSASCAAAGFAGALRLMHSAGGLCRRRRPARSRSACWNPGPAGGGLATAWFGQLAGHKDVISFDMGGTTAKACLIEDGQPRCAHAGGARVTASRRAPACRSRPGDRHDRDRRRRRLDRRHRRDWPAARSGPHSAGADPGPACYGRAAPSPPSPTPACCSATTTRASSWAAARRARIDGGATSWRPSPLR